MNGDPIEILLVEDDENDVELTLRALQGHNLANRVKVVGDGVEALEYLQPNTDSHVPPDGFPRLVMLDLKLPRLGGLEVLERLKASEWTRLIPVVVLTSSREESDLLESYRLGANSFIVKPVDFEQFMRAVAEIGLYWLLLNNVPQ
jgi:two-component system response regulator